jgi:hypothetical protein
VVASQDLSPAEVEKLAGRKAALREEHAALQAKLHAATASVSESDAALRRAWDRGAVLSGGSAGGLCWFEAGTTDSWAGPPVAAWYLPKILRLWAALHIPLLHRSRFYLGFRGRETFYFEAEHRRLAWLQASARGAGAANPLAGAAAALARERTALERKLRALPEDERARLCGRFGVDVGGKRLKRALVGVEASVLGQQRRMVLDGGVLGYLQ